MGSTAASATDRANQDDINICVTVMIHLFIYDPWITVDEMMNYLLWIGPEGRAGRLMRLFGGREIFQRTLDRLEIIRQATVQRRLHELPVGEGRFDGTIPEPAEEIHRWAPQVSGGAPLFNDPAPGESMRWEQLNRYPHEGIYSDDYWDGLSSEGNGLQRARCRRKKLMMNTIWHAPRPAHKAPDKQSMKGKEEAGSNKGR